MRFTNEIGLPAAWTLGFRRDGRELLVVVVKATYALPSPGEEARLADDHVPLIEADCYTGEPGLSAPLHESDFAHSKPACDVLLVGSAYAPRGHATQVDVGLQVGALAKQFRVVGHRRWNSRTVSTNASAPEPFEVLPISYDVAFGGTDRREQAQGRTNTFEANPIGRGYARDLRSADGQPLPNTEAIGERIESPAGRYVPQAYGPVGRNWLPRRRLAGTYDQAWMENTAPLWPEDFDERYFQAAPTDQQIAHPQGGEPVVLRHLTRTGHCSFALPRRRMPILFIPHRGRDLTQEARLDTIVFEPDAERFTLAWRVALPLARSAFDVRETVIGERTQAWHRSRITPGKTYYKSLADAVAVRHGRGGAR